MQQPAVPETTSGEVATRLESSDPSQRPVIVDVREIDEWEEGHIEGAMLVPLSEFQERFAEIPRDRDVVVVCHMGERSRMATAFLRRMGYERAINLRGGMDAWIGEHLPIEQGA